MAGRTSAIVVGGVALCLVAQPAAAEPPSASVTRAEFGAPTVAPGTSVVLRVGLAARSAQQVPVTVSGLPAGARVAGPGCRDQSCTVTAGPVASLQELRIDVPSGTRPGSFGVVVATPGSSVTQTLRVADGAQPRVRYMVDSVDMPVRDGPAQFTARLVNLAGTTIRRVRVEPIVARSGFTSVRATGSGWKCGTRSCRYVQPLAVGQTSSPLRISARVRSSLPTARILPGSAVAGRHGELRWRSTISAPGLQVTNTNSVIVQLRAPHRPRPPAPKVSVPDWTRHSHLETSVVPLTPIRPGGVGRLRVDVLHNLVSHTFGSTGLRVELPRGLSVRRIQDGAWRCSGRNVVRCSLDRRISARAPASQVLIAVRARRDVSASSRVIARVQWRTKAGRHVDVARATCRILRPLRVQAYTSRPVVPATAAGERLAATTVQLHARIRGTDVRMRPSYRWRQTAGPPVRWLTPTSQQIGQREVAVRFRVPVVSKRRTLAFVVMAGANGVRARDRIRIVVLPRKVADFDVRKRASQQVSGKAKFPSTGRNRALRTPTGPTIRIGSRGPTVVQVGGKRTLKAVNAQGWNLTWRIRKGPDGILTGTGSAVTLTAPSQPQLMLVGLRATRDGMRVDRTEVVRIVPARVTAATSTTGSSFCALFGRSSVQASVPGGSLTASQVTTTGSGCRSPNAQITFTDARLAIGAHQFSRIAGSLNATGLSITSGTYVPPSAWIKAMSFLKNPDLSFSMPSGSAITASWSGRGLGPLAGAFTLGEFFFLDLPSGFSGTTTLTFTPGQPQPLALRATATGSPQGSVALDAGVGANGTFTAQVAAADIAVFTGWDGSQATLSGSGSVSQKTAGGAVRFSVSATLSGALELIDGLTLRNVTASLRNGTVRLTGSAAVAAAGEAVALNLAGSYAGADTWSMRVKQPQPWVSPDVTISGLSGSLANRAGGLRFTVQGDVSGLEVPGAVSITDAAARLTNTCATKSCQPTSVRLSVAIAGAIEFGASSTAFKGTSTVNLQTMSVDLKVNIPAQTFGPDGLRLSNIALDIGGSGPPAAVCSSPSPGDEPVTFTATVQDFFGDDAKVTGAINDSGMCLEARLTRFAPTGSATDSSFSDVVMVYSSYATTITLPGSSKPVAVAAETVGLFGGFTAPASMSGTLGGLQGKGRFSAVLTDQAGGFGFNGTVDYVLDSPLYLVGSDSQTQSSLSLKDVTLTVDLAASEFDIQLAADGAYYTPPAANGVSVKSTTPLSVAIDVDLGQASFGFTATAAGGKPVSNAFGQAGLILDSLIVSGTIGAQESLGIAADATLPSGWTSFIGVQSGTPISLVVDISITPCLQFAIGQANQTTAAVNVLNQGVLIADYANVLLAPSGCEFASVDIAPGFALDFNGLIAGDPFAFDASLDLAAGAFSLDVAVAIGEMTIGSVAVSDASFDLDLATNVFDISFGATLEVGDSSLAVKGSYTENGSAVTAAFSAVSQGDVSIAGFTFDNADVDLQYTQAPAGSTLSFDLDGEIGFLDQSIDGTLALTAQNGAVQTASGDFEVSVNLLVVDVDGDLQFAYQAGQGASGSFTDGTVTVIDLITFTDVNGTLAADGAYQVSAYTPIPQNQASAADTWLFTHESGEWNTVFSGTLGVSISGGNGASASVDYSNSVVNVWSQWSWHSWTSWGAWVPIPIAGCAPNEVTPGSPFSQPEAVFYLNPVAVENASQGGSDDDTDACVSFSSVVVL